MEIFPGGSGLSPSKEVNKGDIIIRTASCRDRVTLKRTLVYHLFSTNFKRSLQKAIISQLQSCNSKYIVHSSLLLHVLVMSIKTGVE